MIVDPVEMLMKTSSLLVPTSTPTQTHHHPLPTVISPSVEYQKTGDDGTRTLWVVFVIMLVASLGFTAMAWTVPISKRLYHVVTTLITITAALSYFAMASGQGVMYHTSKTTVENKIGPDTEVLVKREVYFARYIDWAITTPLLLVDLGLLAGLNGGSLLITIVADLIMILTGLFAAFGEEGTPQKWGWYAIACIAYLVVVWQLAINGRAEASKKSAGVANFFVAIAGFTLVLWTAYPIIWGFADGARKVNVDGEIIAYAVLDVLAKPVFGAWLLLTHSRIAETNVEIDGFWSKGLSNGGGIRLGDDDGA